MFSSLTGGKLSKQRKISLGSGDNELRGGRHSEREGKRDREKVYLEVLQKLGEMKQYQGQRSSRCDGDRSDPWDCGPCGSWFFPGHLTLVYNGHFFPSMKNSLCPRTLQLHVTFSSFSNAFNVHFLWQVYRSKMNTVMQLEFK